MTASGLQADITDFVNESDESDQEFLTFNSMLPLEIDVANLYRKLCSDNMINNSNRGHKKSVHVQTDPDILDIPPSWLLAGEKLVDELYTGLGNIINTMYHSPQSYNKQDAMKRANLNLLGLKYFTYENGFWRSKLLPDIKIPDLVETDRQNRALCSDDTKNNLRHLMKVASMLRNVIPFLNSCESYENQQVVDDKMQSLFNEDSPGDLKRSRSPSGGEGSSDHDIDLDGDLVENWSDSGKLSGCSSELCDAEKRVTKRVRKECVQDIVGKKHVILDDSYVSDQIPGVNVSRYTRDAASEACSQSRNFKPAPRLRKKDINVTYTKTDMYIAPSSKSTILASCSKDSSHATKVCQYDRARDTLANSNGGKHVMYNPENCHKNSSQLCSGEKNFIKKNIMDLKTKPNRAGSAASRNYSEARGTSQKYCRKTLQTSSTEMYKKFLR